MLSSWVFVSAIGSHALARSVKLGSAMTNAAILAATRTNFLIVLIASSPQVPDSSDAYFLQALENAERKEGHLLSRNAIAQMAYTIRTML
jgi:hypothetical protein